jgi:hypothetical protein
MEWRDAMTICRDRRRESRLRWSAALSLLTIIALTQAASPQTLRSAFVEPPNTDPPAAGSVLLVDNFVKDSELNPNLWTTDSPFLTAVANASDSPPPTFVPPTLVFGGKAGGMEMSGPDENYQATGVQSLSTFAPPFNVNMHVTPTSGAANAFEIFLASEDLSQFVTVSCNIDSGDIWANAPNVTLIWHFGEEFSPPIQAQFATLYNIEVNVSAKGEANIKIRDTQGVVLGAVFGLQAGGVGPFYLVLGQKIGSAPPTPLGADWFSVGVTAE